jgi:hypothetical protein
MPDWAAYHIGVSAHLSRSGEGAVASRTYWLDLFTWATWQEFLSAGGQVSGFRESRWAAVKQIKPGDWLLCYLTGLSRFIGMLEVTSEAYRDQTALWSDEVFPCRLRVKVLAALTPETAVPIHDLSDRLTFFQNMTSPIAWTGRLRGSPSRWKSEDGQAVAAAINDAVSNPVSRPVDPAKLARRPKVLRARIGPVTVPDDKEEIQEEGEEERRPKAHSEIQWLLLKLGCDRGLDVWVARNDRGRAFEGNRFSKLPRLKAELPLQFDEATNKTVELIDVLWLQGNAIAAAFEIESTSQVYSGLLRMSDLIAMQPNLSIPLYLVAPAERRNRVIAEVNRPTFARLRPPMAEMCRFLSFSALRDSIKQIQNYVKHMKPDFLVEISESCEAEGA